MFTPTSAITGAARRQRVAPEDARAAHPLAARGADEVLVERAAQLRRRHARACGRQRRADDQARQPEAVQEGDRVVRRPR